MRKVLVFLLFATMSAVILMTTGGIAMAMELRSTAFADGSRIPGKYTCDGSDVSPPLAWNGVPAGTKTFALISDDPDAPSGMWVHWVMWNIPASATSLGENFSKEPTLRDGTRQGMSDFRKPGYGGPCPPSGTHRYFFKIYALDTVLELPAAADKARLETAMKGHILAQAQLRGTYSRER